MEFYCTENFKDTIEGLLKNRSYKDLRSEFIDFLGESKESLCYGTKLTGTKEIPFIKKRIGGSSGYRSYYLFLIKDDKVYLSFIHPKTGSKGSSNITNEARKRFYKDVFNSIQDKSYYRIKLTNNSEDFEFTKQH